MRFISSSFNISVSVFDLKRISNDLGWWIHGSVEDTKLSTNKQHSLSRSCTSYNSFENWAPPLSNLFLFSNTRTVSPIPSVNLLNNLSLLIVSFMFCIFCSLVSFQTWFGVLPLIQRWGESLYILIIDSVMFGKFLILPILSLYFFIFSFNVLVNLSIIPSLFPAVKWLSAVILVSTLIPFSLFNVINSLLEIQNPLRWLRHRQLQCLGRGLRVGGPGTPPCWRTRDEFCTVWNSARWP